MKLTTQITIVFGLLIILPLIIFISIFYLRSYRLIEDQYLSMQDRDLPLVLSQLNEIARNFGSDIRVLSELSSLSGLVNATTPEQKAQFKESLQNDFMSLSRSRDWYYQVRYIDESGMEIVRVDQVTGEPFVVPDEKLQNKGDRYYFQEAMKRNPDGLYVSELDLNIENGVLENRGIPSEPEYVPVIRFARVVLDQSGAKRGIIITNIYANKFLSVLRNSSSEDMQYFLSNKEGFFLYHPDESKTFTYQKEGINSAFKDEFPFLYSLNQSEYHLTEGNKHYLAQKINVFQDPKDPITTESIDNYWTLLKVTDLSNFKSQSDNLMLRLLIYGIAVILVAIFFGFFFIRYALSPLRTLQEGTAIVAAGDLEYQIPVSDKDEIGELATNFNLMVSALKKSRDTVEETIRERTSRLTKLNTILIGRELKMAELKKKLSEMKHKYESQ